MKFTVILAAMLSAIALASPTFADGSPGLTGSSLLTRCTLMVRALDGDGAGLRSDDYIQGSFCTGYLIGIWDGLKVVKLAVAPDSKTCLPDGVNGDQMTRIFVKYAREHPEELHLPAAALAISAFAGAFPCAPPPP